MRLTDEKKIWWQDEKMTWWNGNKDTRSSLQKLLSFRHQRTKPNIIYWYNQRTKPNIIHWYNQLNLARPRGMLSFIPGLRGTYTLMHTFFRLMGQSKMFENSSSSVGVTPQFVCLSGGVISNTKKLLLSPLIWTLMLSSLFCLVKYYSERTTLFWETMLLILW